MGTKKRRIRDQDQEIHIVDRVQLEEYCVSHSAVPEDPHEPFVAFYEISGTSQNLSMS